MVLGLLRWLKETRFYERKKKRIIKTLRQEVGRQKKLARCFKKWESYISVLKTETNKQTNKQKTKNDRMFSLAWNIVYWLLKSPCFEFLGMENMVFFEAKSWWKYDIYWWLKSSCFEFFGNGKYSIFLSKKLMERWYLLITEKFLFWTFWGWEIRSFFEAKSRWKYDIYWLLKSFCFELFGDGKYDLFWGEKLMKRWNLLIIEKFLFWANEKFLFWTFRWWEIRSFFKSKS